jgi:D-alanine-D-alanine ligase
VPSLVEYGQLIVDAEVVFPVVHGPSYEDGCLQGLLSFADVAYVGCPVLSSAIGMDKDVARRLACVNGVQSARYKMLSSYANADETRAFCEDVASAFGWPLFVKPCSMGSSVGIHKAHNMDALAAAVSDARRYDVEVVVEAFIQGREIELAVLENKNPSKPPLVSVPGEIRVHHPDGFYSYTAKYLESDQSILTIPADLDDVCIQTLQRLSADIFTRLKCRGMARIDFFVNPETQAIYFNEINTLPGFTSISMYPKLWVASGLPYASLLDELIDLAKMHHNMRQKLVTNYQ